MTAPLILPDPGCSFGYPLGQARKIVGGDPDGDFLQWMHNNRVPLGQCTGRVFNQDTSRYDQSDCWPESHGPVVYPVDLARFLQQAAA